MHGIMTTHIRTCEYRFGSMHKGVMENQRVRIGLARAKGETVVDRYTKVILTVIALCLVTLVGQNMVRPAHAQYSGPVHVIVDQIGPYPALLPLAVHEQ